MRTRSGRAPSQRPDELAEFIQILNAEGCRSYLEIGARHGDTFFEVMRSLPKGSKGVALDLPGGNWGTTRSRSSLEQAVSELDRRGYDVRAVIGDSRSEDVRERVANAGPFDACLIDGDHLYEGVRADWYNYGGLAELVAFHDIDGEGLRQKTTGHPVEVPRLWREIKDGFRHVEIIGAHRGMGIGVLWRDRP